MLAAMETRRSFCRICAAYCGIRAEIENGRLLAVRGDPEHALSRGYSCVKGRRIPAAVNHPERLRACLVREPGGEFATERGPCRSMIPVSRVAMPSSASSLGIAANSPPGSRTRQARSRSGWFTAAGMRRPFTQL